MIWYLLIADDGLDSQTEVRFRSLKQVAKLVKRWSKVTKKIDLMVFEGPPNDWMAYYRKTLDPWTFKDKGF